MIIFPRQRQRLSCHNEQHDSPRNPASDRWWQCVNVNIHPSLPPSLHPSIQPNTRAIALDYKSLDPESLFFATIHRHKSWCQNLRCHESKKNENANKVKHTKYIVELCIFLWHRRQPWMVISKCICVCVCCELLTPCNRIVQIWTCVLCIYIYVACHHHHHSGLVSSILTQRERGKQWQWHTCNIIYQSIIEFRKDTTQELLKNSDQRTWWLAKLLCWCVIEAKYLDNRDGIVVHYSG